MLFNLFVPRIIPFCGIDKEDTGRSYETRSAILGAHSEIENDIYDYRWNSDGLRSVEFSERPEVVALGCSHTLGQGLPEWASWPSLLSQKIGKPVGNISYSGAAINKNVSSFFAMIHQYQYLPKVVVANFANFERFYFVDGTGEFMRDWYINYSPKKTKVTAPWNYEEILPYEWVYYQNLNSIMMLEAFCESNNIRLVWSTWSNGLSNDMEEFLSTNFRHYHPDPTRSQFPKDFEFMVNPSSVDGVLPYYKMYDWDSIQCHKDLYDKHQDMFHYGYDYHKISGEWGPGAHWPHFGIHRQQHWYEFYYDLIKDLV